MITTFFTLILSATFEPPPAKVINKFFTSAPAYVVDCDDQSRHILPKAQWDTINIGDTCPTN